MRRREFITLLGGAAVAWPMMARAQRGALKTIGWLSPRSADVEKRGLAAFQTGLSQTGYVEGNNLLIEYRWADGQYERLPALAADLARLNVAVFVTTGGPQPARAAITASGVTPVVFTGGSDPVKDGLVSSLNKPGGRVTGAVVFTTSLGPKRLELLRELIPASQLIAFLVNPRSDIADMQIKEVTLAAEAVGQKLIVLNASTDREIEDVFESLRPKGIGAVLMSADLFYQTRREQMVALAQHHIRGPNPQRRKTDRSADSASREIRTGDQPQNRQGLRHHGAGAIARPRRRGDRIAAPIAASAHVGFWHFSDLPRCPRSGRYRRESGHPRLVIRRDARVLNWM
jgi:putative tryptophan/tyrosine transport system substrate-binding protein